MFRPHNAYSGNSKGTTCTFPWSFLYISTDIRISQPLNDQILSMLVHAYQNHVKALLDLFLTDSSIELQRLLKTSNNRTPKRYSIKWYSLRRSNPCPQQTVIGKAKFSLYDDEASIARGNARLSCSTVQAITCYLCQQTYSKLPHTI